MSEHSYAGRHAGTQADRPGDASTTVVTAASRARPRDRHPDLPGTVRLRVAPSPTGDPHVGTAYMSLFNLAFVRQQGGRFVLRIEDTDRARFREDSEKQVFDTLRWLGLHLGRGPRRRRPVRALPAERAPRHLHALRRAAARRRARPTTAGAPPSASPRCARPSRRRSSPPATTGSASARREEERARAARLLARRPVVRMLIPDDAPLEFDDLIRGRVSAPRPDDQVILKADGFPTYHLAVVVDDHEMGITHVVRGEEWISSTPKHVLLYQWLGLEPPAFAHMPLLRNTDKSKISKRKNPAARLTWFQEQGYLPEALVNFLALLAYPPAEGAEGEDVEVFGFEEFSQRFDWADVNPVGPIFDLKKLDWLNGVHIRGARGRRPRLPAAALPAGRRRARRQPLARRAGPAAGRHRADPDPDGAPHRGHRPGRPVLRRRRRRRGRRRRPRPAQGRRRRRCSTPPWPRSRPSPTSTAACSAPTASLTAAAIEAALREALVDGLGIKPKFAFGPLRTAVSGRRVSPPLFESMEILGKASTLTRLRALRATL